MIFNKGSSSSHFATIVVNCQAGATVKISCGTWEFTKTATGGSATFTVPISGTWTITVTQGSISKSEDVSVTTYGTTYTKTITLSNYLFKSGTGAVVEWSTYAGHDSTVAGWGCDVRGTSNINKTRIYCKSDMAWYSETQYLTASASASTKNKVDLTNYRTLKITSNGKGSGGVSGTNNNSKYRPSLTNGTTTIDISDLTGSYDISVSGNTSGLEVTNVWLEA